MKIIIDIPKTIYTNIKSSFSIKLSDANTDKVIKAIKNGTSLPKGHGRLIDVSEYYKGSYNDAREFLDNAPTVIEADEEVDNG